MQQHPVPQNVTSYQFRLIGDMTIKQFAELAGGIIVAIIFYYSHFLSYFKFPLAIFSALLGVALAFLPFQERPLDVWIKNFFKSIYSPTQYLWKKEEAIPDLLLYGKAATTAFVKKEATKDESVLEEYLQSLPKSPIQKEINQQELKKLKEINDLFVSLGFKTQATASFLTKKVPSSQPSIKVKVRKLASPTLFLSSFQPVIAPAVFKQKKQIEKALISPAPVLTKTYLKPAISPLAPTSIIRPKTPLVIKAAPPLTPPLSIKGISSPKVEPVKKTVAAFFATDLPMPTPPDVPNIVAGMVLTNEGKILPNALIEIKNQGGTTVRALKTNKLGQFSISSSLENDSYSLSVENDNYLFDIISFRAEGKVIPLIKIKAKNRKQEIVNSDQLKTVSK